MLNISGLKTTDPFKDILLIILSGSLNTEPETKLMGSLNDYLWFNLKLCRFNQLASNGKYE